MLSTLATLGGSAGGASPGSGVGDTTAGGSSVGNTQFTFGNINTSGGNVPAWLWPAVTVVLVGALAWRLLKR